MYVLFVVMSMKAMLFPKIMSAPSVVLVLISSRKSLSKP